MRRRPPDPSETIPPDEIASYRRWCANRGVEPYGIPDELVSMRAAVARYRAWADERAAWCTAHGVDEGELPLTDSEPWDADAI